MMDEHIKKVIDFLRDKANEVEAVHENYTAAQYMKIAAKSLEAGLDPERIIQPGDSLETRYAKELEASQALLALLKKEKEEQALKRWGKERTPAPQVKRPPR